MKSKGIVYLVGAGPGDAGLLTLRGAELLGQADVVVYDALVNRELLRHAPATAECVLGGRRAHGQRVSQEEILRMLVEQARAGKTVVRLKGGDPYVFGRGGEEAEALAKAGIRFEVVPGVSSFAAVPAYAGIPLTHRDFNSKLTILTGHADPESPECRIDWAAEARSPGTKVVMMGTEHIGRVAAVLRRHGMAADMPVAMVSCGTTGRQRTVEGTLATIAELAAQAQLPPPSITVIGEVVRLRERLNWFEHLPLFGRRIVVTRARVQAPELVRRLNALGAEVLEIPCIQTAPPQDVGPLKEAIVGLHEYDWLVFTSANGVRCFFEYFDKGFQDARDIGGVRIAAVGPGTVAALRERRLAVNAMPKQFTGVQVAKAMAAEGDVENLRVCLLRAETANPELPRLLEEKGAIVDDIAVYRTIGESTAPTPESEALIEKGADWITFTSGSTVDHFHARFDLPGLMQRFPDLKLASLGPETTQAMAALHLEPAVEAREHTVEGLVTALERHAGSRHRSPQAHSRS
ncbi:MAG: uroporphyrinogen-III C-methyltransferase [Verrucomicrobia bacterium]|jgi:uroporphyrinogen III methyltransferase/synthase|nr:uroporphyrinogen-III C-methyltransferase [Verrucomicrobiota bacterium]